MTDAWDEATFDGHESAQRRRAATASPAQRLAAVEQLLRDADRLGLIAPWRERKQRDLMTAWVGTAPAEPS